MRRVAGRSRRTSANRRCSSVSGIARLSGRADAHRVIGTAGRHARWTGTRHRGVLYPSACQPRSRENRRPGMPLVGYAQALRSSTPTGAGRAPVASERSSMKSKRRLLQWTAAAIVACGVFVLSGCPGNLPACSPSGERCNTSTDCCGTGICTGGICDSNSCVSTGGSCTRAIECCGGSVCTGGQCATNGGTSCVIGGAACGASSECCGAGLCTSGTCSANSCQASGSACSATPQCCGAMACTGGSCR